MFLKIVRENWEEQVVECQRVLVFPMPEDRNIQFRAEFLEAEHAAQFTVYEDSADAVYMMNDAGVTIESWSSERRMIRNRDASKHRPTPNMTKEMADDIRSGRVIYDVIHATTGGAAIGSGPQMNKDRGVSL